MERTTIVADKQILIRLRAIAHREHVSFAEVVRQGLEWRASQLGRKPKFIGAGVSTELPNDAARRSGEMDFTPRPWR